MKPPFPALWERGAPGQIKTATGVTVASLDERRPLSHEETQLVICAPKMFNALHAAMLDIGTLGAMSHSTEAQIAEVIADLAEVPAITNMRAFSKRHIGTTPERKRFIETTLRPGRTYAEAFHLASEMWHHVALLEDRAETLKSRLVQDFSEALSPANREAGI